MTPNYNTCHSEMPQKATVYEEEKKEITLAEVQMF